jgi:hypothetical protein
MSQVPKSHLKEYGIYAKYSWDKNEEFQELHTGQILPTLNLHILHPTDFPVSLFVHLPTDRRFCHGKKHFFLIFVSLCTGRSCPRAGFINYVDVQGAADSTYLGTIEPQLRPQHHVTGENSCDAPMMSQYQISG